MKPGFKMRCSLADSGFVFSALVLLITDLWIEQLKPDTFECVFNALCILMVSSAQV